uniref:F-box only protein 2 n=1 Tax=Cacopsylla melanoneura TaxID=428564 RepID=A0A8D8T1P8_9HEMI
METVKYYRMIGNSVLRVVIQSSARETIFPEEEEEPPTANRCETGGVDTAHVNFIDPSNEPDIVYAHTSNDIAYVNTSKDCKHGGAHVNKHRQISKACESAGDHIALVNESQPDIVYAHTSNDIAFSYANTSKDCKLGAKVNKDHQTPNAYETAIDTDRVNANLAHINPSNEISRKENIAHENQFKECDSNADTTNTNQSNICKPGIRPYDKPSDKCKHCKPGENTTTADVNQSDHCKPDARVPSYSKPFSPCKHCKPQGNIAQVIPSDKELADTGNAAPFNATNEPINVQETDSENKSTLKDLRDRVRAPTASQSDAEIAYANLVLSEANPSINEDTIAPVNQFSNDGKTSVEYAQVNKIKRPMEFKNQTERRSHHNMEINPCYENFDIIFANQNKIAANRSDFRFDSHSRTTTTIDPNPIFKPMSGAGANGARQNSAPHYENVNIDAFDGKIRIKNSGHCYGTEENQFNPCQPYFGAENVAKRYYAIYENITIDSIDSSSCNHNGAGSPAKPSFKGFKPNACTTTYRHSSYEKFTDDHHRTLPSSNGKISHLIRSERCKSSVDVMRPSGSLRADNFVENNSMKSDNFETNNATRSCRFENETLSTGEDSIDPVNSSPNAAGGNVSRRASVYHHHDENTNEETQRNKVSGEQHIHNDSENSAVDSREFSGHNSSMDNENRAENPAEIDCHSIYNNEPKADNQRVQRRDSADCRDTNCNQTHEINRRDKGLVDFGRDRVEAMLTSLEDETDIPVNVWYDLITKREFPFYRNLMHNPNGDEEMVGWQSEQPWQTTPEGNLPDSLRVASYWNQEQTEEPEPGSVKTCFSVHRPAEYCSKEQLIDLESLHILPATLMDKHRPQIVYQDWYHRGNRLNSYKLTVTLLDSERRELYAHIHFREGENRSGEVWWEKVVHLFDTYPLGVRYIRFVHGGFVKADEPIRVTQSGVCLVPACDQLDAAIRWEINATEMTSKPLTLAFTVEDSSIRSTSTV